jgi:hypothetical protein
MYTITREIAQAGANFMSGIGIRENLQLQLVVKNADTTYTSLQELVGQKLKMHILLKWTTSLQQHSKWSPRERALITLNSVSTKSLVPETASLGEIVTGDFSEKLLGRGGFGSDEDAYRNQVDFDFDEIKHQQQMTRVVQLGMACTLPEPNLRPHSKRLIQALYGDWSLSLPTSYHSQVAALPSSISFPDYPSVTDPLLSNKDIVR